MYKSNIETILYKLKKKVELNVLVLLLHKIRNCILKTTKLIN